MLKSTGWGLFIALSVVACGGDEFQSGDATSGTPPTTGGAGGDGASAGAEGNKGGGGGAGNTGGNGGFGGCSVGSTCVPTPPEGWSPLGFFATGVDAPPAECPGTSTGAIEGGSGAFTAPPATCTACDCDPPNGITCSIPTFNFYPNGTCSGAPSVVDQVTGCFTTPGSVFAVVETTANNASGGSCPPTGGVATVLEAQFEENSIFCEGVGGGTSCEDGGTCVADAAAPFQAGACIHHAGDVDCPAGFPNEFVISTSIDDDRGCEDCECANPTGATCENSVTAHPTIACNSATPTPIGLGGTCQSTGSEILFLEFDPNASGGDCLESGGAVTGSAVPADPVTVCCSG